MIGRAFGLLPILALLSCSTAPKVDPLETKAAEGDPVSACKLVIQDLRQCMAARDAWLDAASGDKPRCMADAVPARHETYLSDAIAKIKGGHSRNIGDLAVDSTSVVQAAFQFDQRGQVISSKVDDLLDLVEKLCPALARS